MFIYIQVRTLTNDECCANSTAGTLYCPIDDSYMFIYMQVRTLTNDECCATSTAGTLYCPIDDSYMCAAGPGNKGSCIGDSGGKDNR